MKQRDFQYESAIFRHDFAIMTALERRAIA